MASPTPKPTTKLSPLDAQRAYSARMDANLKKTPIEGGTYTAPTPTPTAKPIVKSVTQPKTTTTQTTPTATTNTGAGSYGSSVGDAYKNGTLNLTNSVPMNVHGKEVATPISEALKLGQGGSGSLSLVIAALRKSGQIGKTTNNMTTISNAWDKAVIAGMRNQQDPFAYLTSLPTPVTTTKTGAPPIVTYKTDYSGPKGQTAFQAAFTSTFGRNPVAGDQLSPFKDSKGNAISWVTALNNEAQKPANAEVVTRNTDGSMVVSKGGFDAQAWLSKQMSDYYRKGIQTGTMTPEQSVENKYTSAATDYGINVFDPNTKALTTTARNDLASVETGTRTLDDVISGWKTHVLATYGNLAPQLNSGLTLRQITDPATSSMSQILGVDKNSIALTDPLIQKYLSGTDGKSIMPAYQFEQVLRQDPRWNTSKDAQDNLGQVALTLAKTFGVMG